MQDGPSSRAISEDALECEICGDTFPDTWRLSSHKWATHKMKAPFRRCIGDTSECPVCKTDFITRARLIKHLSERRVRSAKRRKTCRDELMKRKPPDIPHHEYEALEAIGSYDAKKARREGHNFELATIRAIRPRTGDVPRG